MLDLCQHVVENFFLQEADDNQLNAAMEFYSRVCRDLVETAGQVVPEAEPNQVVQSKVDNAHYRTWPFEIFRGLSSVWRMERNFKASEELQRVEHKAALDMSLLNPLQNRHLLNIVWCETGERTAARSQLSLRL
jgi:hypothetical protein